MSNKIKVQISDSLVGGIVNALINGYIIWTDFSKLDRVPLTLDMISTQEKSVFGQGISLALALGVIITLIEWKVFSAKVAKKHPDALVLVSQHSFRSVIGMALQTAMFLFGWSVALAVIWQRILGTVYVSPLMAATLVAFFAGLITVIVEMRTKSSLLRL